MMKNTLIYIISFIMLALVVAVYAFDLHSMGLSALSIFKIIGVFILVLVVVSILTTAIIKKIYKKNSGD